MNGNQTYKVQWTDTALNELARMIPYTPDVKKKIYEDALERLAFMPHLTAKPIPFGSWEGYYARLGLYQVILIFRVDEDHRLVSIYAVKHKRQNLDWKNR